jgi:hypothetical protein
LVCFDRTDESLVALVADHVLDGASPLYYDGFAAADLAYRDQQTDTASYKLRDSTYAGARETISVPNINGVWTFAGLADKVGQTDGGDSISDGDTVAVQIYGQQSGRVDDACNNTKRSDAIDYQADMAHHRTQQGDSGGPWVDNSGNLLA